MITLRMSGNLLEIAQDGGPLPQEIDHLLSQELRYTHLKSLRGSDAYCTVTGTYMPVRPEVLLLHRHDHRGRIICGVGFLSRVQRLLEGHHLPYESVCLDPPHPRENRYQVNWDKIFQSMDLRVKQDEMLAAMEASERGILVAPPAVGKTHLFRAYVLAHQRARIHIVSYGIDVLKNIYRHMTRCTGSVGFVGGGKRTWGRVTVISIDSLHHVAEGFDNPRDKRSPDIVLCDEVHRLASQSSLMQLSRYQRCRIYGMTGSLERFDGAHAELESIFGEVIFHLGHQEAQALGLVAPVQVEWLVQSGKDVASGMRSTPLDRWGIWRNQARNQNFAQRASEFSPDTQVLIMCFSLQHALRLKQLLPDFQVCYDKIDPALYDVCVRNGILDHEREPPMTPARREQMRRDFEDQRLLKAISTDVWSTGVDFTRLQVLMRADGRSSPTLDTQIPGRLFRIADGKECALLVDGCDQFNPSLFARSKRRYKNYQEKGWEQTGWPASSRLRLS